MTSAPSVSSSESARWMTTRQAADALGVTERNIRRMCAEAKLGSQVQRERGKKPFRVVSADDVERMTGERLGPTLVSTPRGGFELADIPQVRTPTFDDGARLMATILKARELPAPSPAMILVPHMTLREAAAYSGLPAAFLLGGARAGTIRAVNVGHGKREFWRFPKE